jgi:hypothetical protein
MLAQFRTAVYNHIIVKHNLPLEYAEPSTEVEVSYFGEGKTADVTAEPLVVKVEVRLKA